MGVFEIPVLLICAFTLGLIVGAVLGVHIADMPKKAQPPRKPCKNKTPSLRSEDITPQVLIHQCERGFIYVDEADVYFDPVRRSYHTPGALAAWINIGQQGYPLSCKTEEVYARYRERMFVPSNSNDPKTTLARYLREGVREDQEGLFYIAMETGAQFSRGTVERWNRDPYNTPLFCSMVGGQCVTCGESRGECCPMRKYYAQQCEQDRGKANVVTLFPKPVN